MEITLDQLLVSRENRWCKQSELIAAHPNMTLVCLTVIMPGKVKRNFHSIVVAHAAITALINHFANHDRGIEVRDLVTGYEAYLLTDLSPLEAKRLTCKIENTHKLGRLFDIDVMKSDVTPISRTEVGEQARKCLICDHEARYCMRNHSHTQNELHDKISKMIEDYVQRF